MMIHDSAAQLTNFMLFFLTTADCLPTTVAVGMYEKFGYSIFRRVIEYYAGVDPEDAYGALLFRGVLFQWPSVWLLSVQLLIPGSKHMCIQLNWHGIFLSAVGPLARLALQLVSLFHGKTCGKRWPVIWTKSR